VNPAGFTPPRGGSAIDEPERNLREPARADWETKCWGRVRHVFECERFSVSELEVRPGFRSSIHRHEDRANAFQVVDAEIVVETFVEDTAAPYSRRRLNAYLLGPGGTICVPSGRWHRFRTLRPGRVLELYYADRGGVVRLDDIERWDEGGADNA